MYSRDSLYLLLIVIISNDMYAMLCSVGGHVTA